METMHVYDTHLHNCTHIYLIHGPEINPLAEVSLLSDLLPLTLVGQTYFKIPICTGNICTS